MDWIDIGINCVENLLYAFLVSDYLELKNREKTIFILTLTLIGTIELTILNNLFLYEGLFTLITIILYFLMMLLFDNEEKSNFWNLLIYSIVLDTVIGLGNEMLFLGCHYLFGYTPSQTLTLLNIVYAFFWSRLVVIIIMLMINKYTKKFRILKTKYDSGFVIIFLVLSIVTTLIEGVIIDGVKYLLLIWINFFLFFLVALLYVFFYRSQFDRFQELQKQSLQDELKSLKINAETFRKKEEDIRIMKHDLKNQLTILQGYLDKGQIDKATASIQKNIDILNQTPILADTGHIAIDAIISNKVNNAKERGIFVQSIVQMGTISSETEYDIALILANLLDNAIENISDENKEIRINVFQDSQVKIQVLNTTDYMEVDIKTRKNDPQNHGHGLNSVRIIAEKYDGQLYMDIIDGMFYATVLLDSVSNKN